MNVEDRIIEILNVNKVGTVVTVPCKCFSTLLDKMMAVPSLRLIWSAREEEGLGIATGCYLGGKKSVLMIQNSGLGNMVNAIMSLNRYYGIPFFAIVSHRGGPDEKIEAQKPMGELTQPLIELMGVRYSELSDPGEVEMLDESMKRSFMSGESEVVLIKQSFWKK